MQNRKFETFATHKECRCFNCGNHIGKDELPIKYGFPSGKYGMWCENCKLRTYYDTPDQSIDFDANGDPVEPCAYCKVPCRKIERWDGYMACSNCMGI